MDLSFLLQRTVLRRVGLAALACTLLGVGYALLAPRWYRSLVTVAPARAQRSGLSSLLGGMASVDLGALANGFESAMGGSADAARIAAVLQSVSVSDAVVQKFGLLARYDVKYPEQAREELWRHCELKTLPKPNLVQLSCEDTDPRYVQEMLSFFASYGNEVFRRVNASSASEEVRFLEKRLTELRREADLAAGRMRDFQEQHHIVDLDTQARAVVSTLAALHGESVGKQLELDLGRRYSAPDEPGIRQLESQVSVIGQRMRELEEPASARPGAKASSRDDLFPAALAVPKLRAEYEQLFRDRRVAEASLLFALERLEGARASEAREVSTFQVLDPPVVPSRHARPRRLLVVLGAALLGLLGAAAVEAWRARRRAT